MNTIARLIAGALCLLVFPALAFTQKKDMPPPKPPDEATMELIRHRTTKLREAVRTLPAKTPDYIKADVEIYLKAAEWVVRHEEWVHADSGKWLLGTLDQGLQRAAEAAQGKAPWREPAGKTVCYGYRSKIDGSVQPYAVTFPADYGKDPKKKWRLDIVLHGRDGTICEVKFLYQHNGKVAAKDQDYVQLEVYGRGNNAYRWAGESDVFEAMHNFTNLDMRLFRREGIDTSKTVLRGFSMGGAGTWHIGLHHPDDFCAIGPGAGFTTTHGYVKGLPNSLPPYQEPLLHIYDAVDYAENAFNVPIVAYSGEKDPQKAAANNIEKRLKELKIDRMTHLVAPGLEHQFPPEWQKRAQAEFAKYTADGRPLRPAQVRFTTYTLKYPRCEWIVLTKLERHYERAHVDAEYRDGAIKITTKNVKALLVSIWQGKGFESSSLEIDGTKLDDAKSSHFEKVEGRWRPTDIGGVRELWKSSRLQGPIDDAFTGAFLCVKGTGSPWHEAHEAASGAQLARFEKEWDKWMRGKLPLKADKEVTDDDIKSKNLIVFGDPSSNLLIAKVLPKLPITWDRMQIVVGGQKYDSSKHLPILIYPNPLFGGRYVVLNSGHTFHEAEFKGTNALLFPRLGDYAVVRPMPTAKDPAAFEVMKAGIFDDSWKFAEK